MAQTDITTAFNALCQKVDDNFQYLDSECAELEQAVENASDDSVTGVTGSNATITVTKGDSSETSFTINNVANATNAANATKATQDEDGNNIKQTYATKAELSAVPTMDISFVNSLPTTDISTRTFYFVPASAVAGEETDENDLYIEYIYHNNKWEKLGKRKLDLSAINASINNVKNTSVANVTGSNATVTITKGNGDSSNFTIDNVANATNAVNAAKATNDVDGNPIKTTYQTVADMSNYYDKAGLETYLTTLFTNGANAITDLTA